MNPFSWSIDHTNLDKEDINKLLQHERDGLMALIRWIIPSHERMLHERLGRSCHIITQLGRIHVKDAEENSRLDSKLGPKVVDIFKVQWPRPQSRINPNKATTKTTNKHVLSTSNTIDTEQIQLVHCMQQKVHIIVCYLSPGSTANCTVNLQLPNKRSKLKSITCLFK